MRTQGLVQGSGEHAAPPSLPRGLRLGPESPRSPGQGGAFPCTAGEMLEPPWLRFRCRLITWLSVAAPRTLISSLAKQEFLLLQNRNAAARVTQVSDGKCPQTWGPQRLRDSAVRGKSPQRLTEGGTATPPPTSGGPLKFTEQAASESLHSRRGSSEGATLNVRISMRIDGADESALKTAECHSRGGHDGTPSPMPKPGRLRTCHPLSFLCSSRPGHSRSEVTKWIKPVLLLLQQDPDSTGPT